jgi:L-rhamnonate dehydratase
VVRAIRQAVGPDAPILTDANNGYTHNLARDFLAATAACNLFWLEEAFHEDAMLYRRLRAWLDAEGLATLIADGENRALVDLTGPVGPGVNPVLLAGRGEPSPWLLEMAREGIVDVLQYDVFFPGLTRLLEINPLVAGWGRLTSPHHYGSHLGNYVGAHFGAVARDFGFVEWDEARTPGVQAPGYRIDQGDVVVPPTPGFGLELDEDVFLRAVRDAGFAVSA